MTMGPTLHWRAIAPTLWRRVCTHWRPRHWRVGVGCTTVDEALAQVQTEFAAQAGAVYELGVASRWVQAQALSPALSPDEGWQHALHTWLTVLELDEPQLADEWVVRQVHAAPAGAQLHLVTAMPRALVEGVQRLAAQHQVRIDRMGPWWGPEMAQALPALALVPAEASSASSQPDEIEQGWSDGDWHTRARWQRHAGAGTSAAAGWCLTALWSEPVAASTTAGSASWA
jgi:hypothetical protein